MGGGVSTNSEVEIDFASAFAALPDAAKANLARTVERVGADLDGTSLLELQTGMFRLVQGAAYRVHRGQFSANYHTHQTAKVLPYTFPNFVKLVDALAELLSKLRIDGISTERWQELQKRVHLEYDALKRRISEFDEKSLSASARAEHVRMKEAQTESEAKISEFKEHIGKALLFSEKDGLAKATELFCLKNATEEKKKELQKLHDERTKLMKNESGFGEGFSLVNPSDLSSEDYLQKWNRVILNSYDEAVDGAMIAVRWWHDDLMPALLAACTPISIDLSTREELDEWFEKANSEFSRFGQDVLEAWERLEVEAKKNVFRAWRLTRNYLNGFQKKRERFAESGVDHRETGDLSQYVAFLDIPLNRSYVRDANMRLSFPYFIGNAVWKFKHTVAERACELDCTEIVDSFKKYLKAFSTVYPCPYCRYHLNNYVAIGKERDLYPVEYLLLGWNNPTENVQGEVTLDDKISTINSPRNLRLFVWKLHNAVNSSIYRQEDWYHAEKDAIYTSRYWPNMDSDCHRAKFSHGLLSASKVEAELKVLKAATRLAALRDVFRSGQRSMIEQVHSHAIFLVQKLEQAVEEGGFLQKAYHFDPTLGENDTEQVTANEDFLRHEDFTLN